MLNRFFVFLLLLAFFSVGCRSNIDTHEVAIDSLSIVGLDTSGFIRATFRVDRMTGQLVSSTHVFKHDTNIVIKTEYTDGFVSSRRILERRSRVVYICDFSPQMASECGLYEVTDSMNIPNGDHVLYFPCSDAPKLVIPMVKGKVTGVEVEYSDPGVVSRKSYYRDDKSRGAYFPKTGKIVGDTVLSRP